MTEVQNLIAQAKNTLQQWCDDGRIRAIDQHLALQLYDYEVAARLDQTSDNEHQEALVALLFAAVAVSDALGRGQVCWNLAQWHLPNISLRGLINYDRLASLNVVPKLLVLHQQRLYLARYFSYETNVRKHIERRLNRGQDSNDEHTGVATSDELAKTLRSLFPRADLPGAGSSNAINLQPDWQCIAAATACLQPFCIITGGPGTGKTTTVTRLLNVLLSQTPDLRIALAAPTGKAAARMTESIRQARLSSSTMDAGTAANASEHHKIDESRIPNDSFTLHRLLGWSPRGFRYHGQRSLPFDCVVVDEASMIDLPMMSHLFDALAPSTRLILLGDRDQLASVEAGSVLADMCDAGHDHGPSADFAKRLYHLTGYDLTEYVEALGESSGDQSVASPIQNAVVQLRTSHRFRADSGIGLLAASVNRGDSSAALATFHSDAHLYWYDHGDAAWLTRIELGMARYCQYVREQADPSVILDAFNDYQVLVAVRQGPHGLEETNALIERLMFRRGLLKGGSSKGGSSKGNRGTWYPGRAIMITRNDYDLGLFNGDIGVAVEIHGEERVAFRTTDGQVRLLSPGRLPSHETAFAMTVHKSQGSEYQSVILLLPKQWQPVMTRELIYTAITRARNEFHCVGDAMTFQRSLESQVVRASGLRDALWT
ncbi:MAG: exodeoxyribonuclease V subunit alpha [Oleibacter sp.]|nr:exodeoxyribonuclease V subunit alpha [Thalassolituus sp.]